MTRDVLHEKHDGGLNPWHPLRNASFRYLWMAAVFSNVGTWIQHTAMAWLITSITSSPVMVSLVQTANSLPIFLLVLPAGALADMFDRRRVILLTQTWMLTSAAACGLLTAVGWATPWSLLTLTLILGFGAALNAPAWQAIIPELVATSEIPSAVALNSAGFNLARSVGPALGGLIVGLYGAEAAFFLNALSYCSVIIVLYTWKRETISVAPTGENLRQSMVSGFRYVRESHALRPLLLRVASFVICASSLMALLPLYAKEELHSNALEFGLLLGSFGLGAVLGALLLPLVRSRLSLEALSNLAPPIFAMTLFCMASVTFLYTSCGSLLLAGVSWLILLSSFNGAIQITVPPNMRGRAMAMYMFIFFGGMALGSILWGGAAQWIGTRGALTTAAVVMSTTSIAAAGHITIARTDR